ncbi:MAG: hypothetical protein WBC65_07430 [Ignavibacteria bacterium]
MYTHSLLEVLKTFSNKEIMRFGKFLKSPYFNNRSMLIKLFSILKLHHPEFDNKNITKLYIYKKLYGNAAYNDSTLRNLMSDLQQLALNFIKTESFRKNEIESTFFLTDELAQRGLVKLFSEKIQTTEKTLGSEHEINSSYFLSKFRTQTDQFYMNLQATKVLKKGFVEVESKKLINGIIFIMSYFVIESVRHNDNLLKYSRSYNISSNMKTVTEFMKLFDISKIVKFIKSNSDLNIPIIEAYYKLLLTFLNFQNDQNYSDLKHFLKKNSKEFSLLDNHFLFARLMDYCVLKKNTGAVTSFHVDNEIFEILTEIISKGYYRTDSVSHIPFDLYRNYLINCIALKKLNQMEDFISTFSSKLNPNQITNVENYSYALLSFERGDFIKALELLSKIKFDQFIYKLDMKNLSLKIHYELEQYDSALSVIDTYKHFINNNVLVSDNKRTLHYNFISYVNKLIQYKLLSRNVSLLFLEDKLMKSQNTFNKEWILEKLQQEKMKTGKKAI